MRFRFSASLALRCLQFAVIPHLFIMHNYYLIRFFRTFDYMIWLAIEYYFTVVIDAHANGWRAKVRILCWNSPQRFVVTVENRQPYHRDAKKVKLERPKLAQ